jgi:hypothetical protein
MVRRLLLTGAAMVLMILMTVLHAESWTCQSATCTARLISGGTTTTVTVQRDGEIVPGSGVTLILDTGSWHHNP